MSGPSNDVKDTQFELKLTEEPITWFPFNGEDHEKSDLWSFGEETAPDTEIEMDMEEISRYIDRTVEILEREKIYGVFKFDDTPIIGVEVGDDRLDCSQNPLHLAFALMGQEEIYMMKTSPEDTFISDALWNLCEHSDMLPFSPDQSWERARKTGSAKDLAFTDYPPLRVVVDAGGANQDHLKSVTGKSMLLAGQSTLTRPECSFGMEVANYLQDGLISSYRGSEPKYLPRILGGCGSPSPFGVWENLYLSVLAFRGGGYSRVYGSATSEARRAVYNMDRGDMKVSTPLLQRLRQKQEYLHGTYGNLILVPTPQMILGHKEEAPKPLYEVTEVDPYLHSTEERILRTRELIKRPQAELEIAQKRKILRYLFEPENLVSQQSVDLEKSREARRKFEDALSSNSAFSNLLRKTSDGKDVGILLQQGFDVSESGVSRFDHDHAGWIFTGCKGEVFIADDIPIPHDVFVREEVSIETTLKVGGVELKPLQKGTSGRFQVTTTKVGLYQIGRGMLEWSKQKVDQLLSVRARKGKVDREDLYDIYSNNLEWVRDDSPLLGQAIRLSQVTQIMSPFYYVGKDIKLARRIANSACRTIYVVDPAPLAAKLRMSFSSETKLSPRLISSVVKKTRLFIEPSAVIYDSGSVYSSLVNLHQDEDGGKVYERYLLSYGHDSKGNRQAKYRVSPVDSRVYYKSISPVSSSLTPNKGWARRREEISMRNLDLSWRHRSRASNSDGGSKSNTTSTGS